MDCLFCKIARKELPAKIVYEDDLIMAFDDIHPKATHHKLIIPHKHIATLNDLTKNDTQLAGHMLYTAQQIAKQLNIADDGYRVVMNVNEGGGQMVFHIHLHVLGGKFFGWP